MDNFFADQGWQRFGSVLDKKTGAYPNHRYFKADENLGAVVSFKGQSDAWSLNQNGVNYLLAAVRDGKIRNGYVVLAAGKPPEMIACKPVAEVVSLLGGAPPRDGAFGRYWWVDQEFRTDQVSAVLIEAPY